MENSKNTNVYSDFRLEYLAQKASKSTVEQFIQQLDLTTLAPNVVAKIKELATKGEIKISIPNSIKNVLKKIPQNTNAKNMVVKVKDEITIQDVDGNIIATAPLKNFTLRAEKLMKIAPLLLAVGAIAELSFAINSVGAKVTEVLKGQFDDREAKCIAALETYSMLQPVTAPDTQADLLQACLFQVNEGLVQIHMGIERLYQQVCMIPKNNWELIKQTAVNLFSDKATEQGRILTEFTYALFRYKKLLFTTELMIRELPIGNTQSIIQILNNKYDNFIKRIHQNQDILVIYEYFDEQINGVKEVLDNIINNH